MSHEAATRDSLDKQIMEARGRAELFSKSLQNAREQEAVALQALEQERMRWASSFEEKSVMIEQLEKELTFTVGDYDVEKSFERVSASVGYSDSGASASEFHGSPESVRQPQAQARHRQQDLPSMPLASTPPADRRIRYPMPEHASTSPHNIYDAHTHAHDAQSGRDDSQIWRDLLWKYQEQMSEARGQLEGVRTERDGLAQQVSYLRSQLAGVGEERQLLLTAVEHAEGKLQFRVAQVRTRGCKQGGRRGPIPQTPYMHKQHAHTDNNSAH
jgi:hypothetical protein